MNALVWSIVCLLGVAVARAQEAEPSRPDAVSTNTAIAAGQLFRRVLAVQTVLDRHNLSGGRIDGVIGPRTRGALEVWQAAHGLPVTGGLDDATRSSVLADGANLIVPYTVTSEDHANLVIVPETWAEKATLPYMGYETILEMLAEKFHASERVLQTLNPDADWPDPPAGTELIVPNPFPAVAVAAERVKISLGGKWVRVQNAAGAVVAHFPCSIAANKSKRPVGELQVVVAASEPNYTFDPVVFPESPESKTLQGRKLIISPGPNNPVGLAWVGLSLTGYGMHGTPHPGDIGKTESHGCFRLANWNAVKLLKMVQIGIPVVVQE